MLQGGNEREPHGLARDGPLRRVGVGGDERVWDRLDPRDFWSNVQIRLHRLPRRAEVHRPQPMLATSQHVQTDVRGDAMDPGLDGRPALEAVEAAPRAQERLLHGILGLEWRGQHPVAVRQEVRAVFVQLAPELAVLRFDPRPLHDANGNGAGSGGGLDLGRHGGRSTR